MKGMRIGKETGMTGTKGKSEKASGVTCTVPIIVVRADISTPF